MKLPEYYTKITVTLIENVRPFVLSAFIISCFFNSVEFPNPITDLDRFELKPTMLTFPLLLILAGIKIYQDGLGKYHFVLLWGVFVVSHFISIFNSPALQTSLLQSILIMVMALVSIATAYSLSNRNELTLVFKIVGFFSVFFIAWQLGIYYTDLDYYGRLGGNEQILKGGPLYIGELLLITTPFVFFFVSQKNIFIKFTTLTATTLAICLTLSKGIILSFIFFQVLMFFGQF